MAVTMGMGNAIGSPRASDKGFLPMTLEEYLALLDWTGRELRADKRGAIPAELLPILERLQIQPESWLDVVVTFDRKFRTVVGRVAAIRREALRRRRRWLHGLSSAAAICEPAIAQALMEYAPPDGYPPVSAGLLDGGMVWRAICRHVFDMGEREPDQGYVRLVNAGLPSTVE
jgi:hypothetical protein